MSLTPQDERRTTRRSGGGWGWLVPLLLVAPTIINEVRRRTTGVLTNEQLLMIAAGVGALVLLVVVGRRAFGPGPAQPRTSAYQNQRPASMPAAPRFEPMVTGKVLLAGLVLGSLFALGVVALLAWL